MPWPGVLRLPRSWSSGAASRLRPRVACARPSKSSLSPADRRSRPGVRAGARAASDCQATIATLTPSPVSRTFVPELAWIVLRCVRDNHGWRAVWDAEIARLSGDETPDVWVRAAARVGSVHSTPRGGVLPLALGAGGAPQRSGHGGRPAAQPRRRRFTRACPLRQAIAATAAGARCARPGELFPHGTESAMRGDGLPATRPTCRERPSGRALGARRLRTFGVVPVRPDVKHGRSVATSRCP